MKATVFVRQCDVEETREAWRAGGWGSREEEGCVGAAIADAAFRCWIGLARYALFFTHDHE